MCQKLRSCFVSACAMSGTRPSEWSLMKRYSFIDAYTWMIDCDTAEKTEDEIDDPFKTSTTSSDVELKAVIGKERYVWNVCLEYV